MALIAVASDKGAPGVTTTALALASVWPEPVLLAECDPAGGDLVFRFPAADGRQLDPRRGLLSLAVAGRRDYQQQQVWQHTQKIHGGLDVLLGVTNAEQGAGLSTLWGPLARMLGALPGTDVIADCGRLGPEGPFYELLAEADAVLLVTRPEFGDIIRLRDRAAVVMADAVRRGRSGFAVDVLTIADPQRLKTAESEVTHALAQAGLPVRLSCGLADDRKGADLLRGTWGGKLDKSLLIRTAREAAGRLTAFRPSAPADDAQQSLDQARPTAGQPPLPYGPEPGTVPAPPAPPTGPVPTFHPRHASGSPAPQSPEYRPHTYDAAGLQPDGFLGR
jgi:MinD-like ATPase involved in chromosome partitioning or flagellar assembly